MHASGLRTHPIELKSFALNLEDLGPISSFHFRKFRILAKSVCLMVANHKFSYFQKVNHLRCLTCDFGCQRMNRLDDQRRSLRKCLQNRPHITYLRKISNDEILKLRPEVLILKFFENYFSKNKIFREFRNF